jgi:plasmid stabilization system protein ParE
VTWRLIVEAQAEAEILETATWYGRRRIAVREEFLAAVMASLAAIEINPLQYQIVRGTVRRVRVGRFPIALLYSVAGDDVVVTVCIHTSRDPRRWHGRFPP